MPGLGIGKGIAAAALAAAGTALAAAPAAAHARHALEGSPWSWWSLDPWVVVPLILTVWVYLRGVGLLPAGGGAQGAAAGGGRGRGGNAWNHAAFFAGLAVFYVMLQSPIEPISDRVFIVHQIEHMGLRTIGPMLVMLAAPEAVLIRGLPRWARGGVLAPVAGNRVVRGLFGLLAHPVGATAIFLGASLFWMIPVYHDLAILDVPTHYLWHATLMISGLIFFWRVLDPRDRPLGASLPTRFAMLWFAAICNILLGAYLSFKETVLYSAYAEMGRMWGIDAATDERFGGLTMWIPGTMMFAMAMLALVNRWRQEEARGESARRRRGDGATPVQAADFRAARQRGNRAFALGILGFVVFVFALAVVVAVIYTGAFAAA